MFSVINVNYVDHSFDDEVHVTMPGKFIVVFKLSNFSIIS